jgi:hypothetical protein
MWNFEELFDSSSVAESLGLTTTKAASSLPFDDWKWQASPAGTSTQDALEQSDFANKVAGESTNPEFAFGPGSPELTAFRKIVPAASVRAPLVSSRAMDDLLKRLTNRKASESNWDAPKHRVAIQKIVDKLKNSPVCKPLRNDPDAGRAWDKLVGSAVDYVAQTVHECVVEV